MTGLPVRHVKTEDKSDHLCEKDFCGVMDFNGNASGTCAICMPEGVLRRMSAALTQFDEKDVDDTVLADTIGEIVNQIAGAAKSRLDKTPYGFQISTPRKIIRQKKNFSDRTDLPCVALRFEIDKEETVFLLSIISADGVPLESGGEPTATPAHAPEQEEKLQIEEDMKEIVAGFIVETEEMLAKLDQDLVGLEATPGDMEMVNQVFRAFHTLKGNSGALGFLKLQELDHRTEDIIRKVRDGKMALKPEAMDVILRSVDMIKGLVADIKRGVVSKTDITGIEAELALALEEKYDELKALRASRGAAPGAPAAAAKKEEATTIRVDTGKLDKLIDVTGELTLTRNRLLSLVQRLEQGFKVDDLEEALNDLNAQLGLQVSGLQGSVMSARMQPIGKVFSKYTRVVRDLSRDAGKEIDLVITGQDTELDNTIVEEIGDPLIHMVRNSCDHGIETPEVRIKAGKPGKGRLELKAYQEGSFVYIEVKDDGKGLDPERIKAKGIEKGLITAERAKSMAKPDILNMIFLPGFSTAEKVTEVSGRGVGMDVVNSSIAKLNGVVELDSEVGKGTTVKIRLPLTLAVMLGLEVEVGEEKYLIPQEALVEIVPLGKGKYAEVRKTGKFMFRNRFLNPVVDLKRALNCESNGDGAQEQGYIVVIGEVEKRTGLLVDNVLRQHEVVIKPLGRYITKFAPPAVNGATLMGDGSIELIMNARYLIGLGQLSGAN
jgi:two-component system, chemotaxis family, sensor kinase CheA